MAILTPKQVAADIRVRPGPNGGYYYNGLLTLEDAARRIEPAILRFDARTKASFLKLLRRELGLDTARTFDHVRFELVA